MMAVCKKDRTEIMLNIIHYTYLGKYIGLSYFFKPEKLFKPRIVKLIKKNGFHKGEITRILKTTEKHKLKSYFNHSHYNIEGAYVQVNLKSEFNEKEVAITGKGNQTARLLNIKKEQPCDCGCGDIAVDNLRGETFCPKCGYVHDNIMLEA